MNDMQMIRDEVTQWLHREGYNYSRTLLGSRFFEHRDENRLIIIDHGICEAYDLSYESYLRIQNQNMNRYSKLYRFAVDDSEDLEHAVKEYELLLSRERSTEQSFQKIVHRGSREDSQIDPTPIESSFETAFFEIYGRQSYSNILREVPFLDVYGTERYYDYLVELREPKVYIAIEQNGVRYHHPIYVGKKQYLNQLKKQNSFAAGGNKLFRWSIEGMIDWENFTADIRRYLGSPDNFQTVSTIKAPRSFVRYDHQNHLLSEMAASRSSGNESFLIVLPTGTGKTAILLDDLTSFYEDHPFANTLIMEPTVHMCNQIRGSIEQYRLPSERIEIHTYSWVTQHYREFESSWFDYIAVDEAHHAVAPSLRRAIQHFTPRSLIGMTATDKRPDNSKLEHVFGEYDTHLSLKEAILKGILAPIHAFRVKSNLDLSSIRYNGKDYTSADLQKHVIIDSRDQLIVDVLTKYFSGNGLQKQGVIFCVSVKHAERMAARLREHGLTARAVSGEKREQSLRYLKEYQEGAIQFITTCSLIHEGWDSPQTAIIVMARPTMSKVLYTQQLGRGTRRCEGKEALYVIDVVDNYGPLKNPWSIHSIMGTQYYKPWGNILLDGSPDYGIPAEEIVLSGLYEYERKIEKINIFSFEETYGHYLSTEQMARELFVSTGTVKNWMRKRDLEPDVTVPFGRSELCYFSPARIPEIRTRKGLTVHDESTIVNDFYEFLEKRDYTFSYKIIFMLSLLNLCDDMGSCRLDHLTDMYSRYYSKRLSMGQPVDRNNCPYTEEYLQDSSKMQRSILSNPFEKFERKRFMFHQKPDASDKRHKQELKDLNNITFHHILWDHLADYSNREKIEKQLMKDLSDYYSELGGDISFTFSPS